MESGINLILLKGGRDYLQSAKVLEEQDINGIFFSTGKMGVDSLRDENFPHSTGKGWESWNYGSIQGGKDL